MLMKNPPHPGEIVREDCLLPLGLTVTSGARALGVSRKVLSDVVNGRAGISALMAIRLARVFGGAPETWLGMQAEYDLARAERAARGLKLARVERPAA
jgi:antitoxin HigA-1